jgi:hypothetical protein
MEHRAGLHMKQAGASREVRVDVVPLGSGSRPHFLVLFDARDRARG